jgi:hypothetical protein
MSIVEKLFRTDGDKESEFEAICFYSDLLISRYCSIKIYDTPTQYNEFWKTCLQYADTEIIKRHESVFLTITHEEATLTRLVYMFKYAEFKKMVPEMEIISSSITNIISDEGNICELDDGKYGYKISRKDKTKARNAIHSFMSRKPNG